MNHVCVPFVQLALAEAQYDLAAELLRFVVPPTDNDNLFASINGAHGAGQQAGAAKSGDPAPPRVRRRLMPLLVVLAVSASRSTPKPLRLWLIRQTHMPASSRHVLTVGVGGTWMGGFCAAPVGTRFR